MFGISKRQRVSDSQNKFTHVDAFLILLTETLEEEHVKYSVRIMSLEVLTVVLLKIHFVKEVVRCRWAGNLNSQQQRCKNIQLHTSKRKYTG